MRKLRIIKRRSDNKIVLETTDGIFKYVIPEKYADEMKSIMKQEIKKWRRKK